MTVIESVQPAFEVRYTIEELAVLADLFDLPSLPGVTPIEMSLDLRSLATRCLVARQIVRMPDDGGVEVTQPHATLIAGVLDAPMIRQVIRTVGDTTDLWSWFDLESSCVRVSDDKAGVIDLAVFVGTSLQAIESTMGIAIEGPMPAGSTPEVVVEMATTLGAGDDVQVGGSVAVQIAGHWYSA